MFGNQLLWQWWSVVSNLVFGVDCPSTIELLFAATTVVQASGQKLKDKIPQTTKIIPMHFTRLARVYVLAGYCTYIYIHIPLLILLLNFYDDWNCGWYARFAVLFFSTLELEFIFALLFSRHFLFPSFFLYALQCGDNTAIFYALVLLYPVDCSAFAPFVFFFDHKLSGNAINFFVLC